MADVHTFTGDRTLAVHVARSDRSQRVSLDKPRKELAYDAAAEIYAISQVLLRETEVEQSEFERDLIQRNMLHRVDVLSNVVLPVLGGDDGRDTNEMHRVVHHKAKTQPA